MLAKQVVELRRHPDKYYFVICFLYRHAVELYLKQICQLGNEIGLVNYSRKLAGSHDLQRLWDLSEQVLLAIYPEDDPARVMPVADFIERCSLADPRADGFRYATSKNGELNLADLPEQIDFYESVTAFESGCDFLEGCLMGVEIRVEYIRQQRYEARG
jgi:hypothetical protein